MKSRIEKAFIVANNALYFNDSSDYVTALWEICSILMPEVPNDEIGEKYIEE